CQKYSSSPFSF
nr:immunoglobulin light chain junction region [Macaca mulatta]MOW09095.1 immunoglobulin light chain junction region [Macaca mulatta]MOW09293.1 immunoglobulin light chain junction region [Macaca mulatta]MOW09759.1 immunoglobulin light chain junction region [Macaca mulatta]MOW11054.1 immunoglobulin light chain junction region [Macaca mulatta]